MKYLIRCIVMLSVLNGCHPERDKPVDPDKLRYQMTDASELFFKNIRKSNYRVEEMPEAGMDLYTHEMLSDTTMVLHPVIIINWRADLAYFYLENNSGSDTLHIQLGSESEDRISYDGSNQAVSAALAARIYNLILNGQEIYYEGRMGRQLLFSNVKQAQLFRIMFFDYLRLVDLR